jgi:ATP-binding cassette subfamily B (MDR/TAP) protein 1
MVLGARTIASLNAQEQFFGEYSRRVHAIAKTASARHVWSGLADGLATGVLMPVMGGMFLLGFYLGEAGLVPAGEIDGCEGGIRSGSPTIEKTMVPVMVAMTVGLHLGFVLNSLTDMKTAKDSAVAFFERLDAINAIDASSDAGRTLESPRGEIQVTDVRFAYPNRPKFCICRGYSLSIRAGQTVALCGASGSGKSTIIQLLLRFYDPSSGSVLLDGVDIKTLNVRWLRSQMGYVGQEPVLFTGTVAENISYGKAGGEATREEIEAAAKMANAHGFISESLAEGYATQVGIGGGQLSGGQKQRVAIARAIIRKPAILLLDEATSALDNESERVVQGALDELMAKQKRTTVVIAHRLSTIRHADKIAVVDKGKVAEEGTHDELMAMKALYYHLIEVAEGRS